jgi:NADH-quinone oxidoreductase subunit K
MSITLNQVLVLAAAVFTIGLYGALTRKSVVIVVMCVELMFAAVNINLVAFTYYSDLGLEALRGQVFAIFIMVVSACELGLCMAIAILLYRNRKTVRVDELDVMKW